MTIDAPKQFHLPALKALWKEAFGDTDTFLDTFEKSAFSYHRCRCITDNDTVAAALYWFDCSYEEGRIAYLYAIATAKSHRGRGLCRALMEDTHKHLKKMGYCGTILVPGSPELFSFYQKMGYRTCSTIGEIRCAASKEHISVRQIDATEYAKARRALLPRGGVIQENENLKFLKVQASFYKGDGFLLSAREEDGLLLGVELLGDGSMAPAILCSLGYSSGRFRVVGNDRPFAMFYALEDKPLASPSYFGLAFD